MKSCINYEHPLNNPKHDHAAERSLKSQKESLCCTDFEVSIYIPIHYDDA